MAEYLNSTKLTYEKFYTPAANDELVRQSRQLMLIANQLGNDADVKKSKEEFFVLIAPLSKIIDDEKEALKILGKQKSEDLKALGKQQVELESLKNEQAEYVKSIEKAMEDHDKATDQNR